MAELVENSIPAEKECAWCGAHLEPHSQACPNGERYKQVQAMGGVPVPDMPRRKEGEAE